MYFLIFAFRYECIVDSLDTIYKEKREPGVYGIRLSMTNKKVVATILLLTDILRPIDILILARTTHQLHCATRTYENTVETLTGLIEIYKENLEDLKRTETEFFKCEDLFTEINERTELGQRLRMDQAVEILTPRPYLEETGTLYLRNFLNNVEQNFLCNNLLESE